MGYSTFWGKKCGALCAKMPSFIAVSASLASYLATDVYATNYELQKYSPNVDWGSNPQNVEVSHFLLKSSLALYYDVKTDQPDVIVS